MKILFLSPQIPYPPISGGVIKSFRLLKYLSENYEVSYAGFLKEDNSDYLDEFLNKLHLNEFFIQPLFKPRNLKNLLFSYFFRVPLTIFRNYDCIFKRKIHGNCRRYDCIFIDHYLMFQYVPPDYNGLIVLHQHNAEYVMWSRMSLKADNVLEKIVLSIEASRIKKYEKNIIGRAKVTLAAPNDIEALNKIGCDKDKFIETYHLGDEENLLAPNTLFRNTKRSFLFVGTLTWEANIDGLLWFLNCVWPLVCEKDPNVTFDIIGKDPDKRIVEAVKNDNKVRLLGFVEELETYYSRSRVFVSPLRFGSGIKVKVVNAMYRGIPTVTTSVGAEGLDIVNGVHALLSEDPVEMANDLFKLLEDEKLWESIRDNSRKLMSEKYTWDKVFTNLKEAIDVNSKLL